MIIKCPKCQNAISLTEKVKHTYAGQKITIKCPQISCQQKLRLTVPKHQPSIEEEMTEINPHQVLASIKAGYIEIYKSDNNEPQSFKLEEGINVIGRLSKRLGVYIPDIPIKTKDSFISKKHCQINMATQRNGNLAFLLKDCNSSNGTFLNKSTVPLRSNEEIYLENGDEIKIGDTYLRFKIT